MKAIVCTKLGPPEVLQLTDVEKPSPKENEVLIRVCAATVTQGDVMLRSLSPLMSLLTRMLGFKRKRIPGHELAGDIEAVGQEVSRFRNGDQVFGTTTRLSVGSNAEYVCLPEAGMLALRPTNMTCEEAAAVPIGGLTALFFLRKGNIKGGKRRLSMEPREVWAALRYSWRRTLRPK